MHSEGGAVMFGREEPVDSSGKSLLLLRGDGIGVPPISYPGYMPSGEITLNDPDGYAVLVA